MKTKRAIKLAGGQAALGRIFAPPITRQSIHMWGEDVPELRLYQLRDLRPDWFKKKEAR